MRRGTLQEHGHLKWRGDISSFRIGHALNAANFTSNPTGNQWIYFYARDNGTNLQAGWKDIDDVAFTEAVNTSLTSFGDSGNNPTAFECGANPFATNGLTGFRCFRVSVWNEPVSNANLLLAAATDLGYITNLNTHLPLTNGVASPYADTSGNARDWTATGTIGQNQSDPALGPSVQLAAPTSDISAGNWLRSSDNTGTGLYTMLDEATFSDTDYVYVNSDSTMEVKFASVSDPATSSGHKVRYRIKGNGVATITVSLRQGSGTEIASWAHTTASTSVTAYEQTLSSGQADSITDYADLRLRFVTFTP
jgi:hypothetical protein